MVVHQAARKLCRKRTLPSDCLEVLHDSSAVCRFPGSGSSDDYLTKPHHFFVERVNLQSAECSANFELRQWYFIIGIIRKYSAGKIRAWYSEYRVNKSGHRNAEIAITNTASTCVCSILLLKMAGLRLSHVRSVHQGVYHWESSNQTCTEYRDINWEHSLI